MEAEFFNVSFLLSEEEGMYGKLHANRQNMEYFAEEMGFDPIEIFQSEEFQGHINAITELFFTKMEECLNEQ